MNLEERIRELKNEGIRKVWVFAGFLLILAGFICDDITSIGHHALLILGGIVVGMGINRKDQ